MATYALRGLDPDLITAAKARARDAGTTLDAVLRAALEQYAAGQSTPAATLGSAGGRARAASLSEDERSASARQAARARWRK